MEKETFLIKLGERIRNVRTEKGLTQVELAHLIGKDQQSIQRIEKGAINPSIYYLKEISVGLGVPLEGLLKY